MFSIMNYMKPLRGIASMHCSANTDMEGTSSAISVSYTHLYRLPAFILISTEEVESLIHLRRYCTSVSDRYVECQ